MGYVHRVDFEFCVAFYVVVVAQRKAFSPKRSFDSFITTAFGVFSFSREEALEEEDGKMRVVFFFGCAMPIG